MNSRTPTRASPSGALTDIVGLQVGHFTDSRRPTGCTVVLCPAQGATAAVDVRGAAPGTRETDLLAPINTVDVAHAIVLSGGSAFGLDSASGVMRWLAERDIGLPVGPARVPIVPAAVLFDLWLPDASVRPDADAGYAACRHASSAAPAEGSVGAGAGATVGKLFGIDRCMRGGIGSASLRVGELIVAALVAVNAIGDVLDPLTGSIIAGARSADGNALMGTTATLLAGRRGSRLTPPAGSSTTIGVIATNATLTKAQAQRVAMMSHDGLARVVDPVHTPFDGDTMFCLATGALAGEADLMTIGALAARVSALAVVRGVRNASAYRSPDGALIIPTAE